MSKDVGLIVSILDVDGDEEPMEVRDTGNTDVTIRERIHGECCVCSSTTLHLLVNNFETLAPVVKVICIACCQWQSVSRISINN